MTVLIGVRLKEKNSSKMQDWTSMLKEKEEREERNYETDRVMLRIGTMS